MSRVTAMGTNKNFEQQMVAFRRAWEKGTAEYEKRLSYPGPVAATRQCNNGECINFSDGSTVPSYTMWLCSACADAAPDPIIEYRTHAPQMNVLSASKARAIAASVFTAWRSVHPRSD